MDFQCEKCGFATYAKRYLQAHLKKVHQGEEEYKHMCEDCGKRFLYPFDLKKHHVIISLLKAKLQQIWVLSWLQYISTPIFYPDLKSFQPWALSSSMINMKGIEKSRSWLKSSWFINSWFKRPGLKSSWLKSSFLKSPRIGMSYNWYCPWLGIPILRAKVKK